MKRVYILTEENKPYSLAITKLKEKLTGEKFDVKIAHVPSLPVGSLDPVNFDIVYACPPSGHTNLPKLSEVVMAVIAGSPTTSVKSKVVTYSGQKGLQFYDYSPDKMYGI